MIYVLVHGFNTNADWIDDLRNQFASLDHRFAAFRYGKIGLLGVRSANPNLAEALSSFVQAIATEPLTLVGHSNGCALINRALQSIPWGDVPRIVYLSPALEHDATPPDGPDRIDVCHTRKDDAVWWARFLLWHEWGDMGRRGYSGSDPRVHNHDFTGVIKGHSEWFTDCGWLAQTIVGIEALEEL